MPFTTVFSGLIFFLTGVIVALDLYSREGRLVSIFVALVGADIAGMLYVHGCPQTSFLFGVVMVTMGVVAFCSGIVFVASVRFLTRR